MISWLTDKEKKDREALKSKSSPSKLTIAGAILSSNCFTALICIPNILSTLNKETGGEVGLPTIMYALLIVGIFIGLVLIVLSKDS